MQPVDILGDDMADMAATHELGDRHMPPAGLDAAELLADRENAPPSFQALFFRAQEFVESDWLVLRPEATWRAEIGDAAFGRDACARERNRTPRALDHRRQFFYVSLSHGEVP